MNKKRKESSTKESTVVGTNPDVAEGSREDVDKSLEKNQKNSR